jgi:FtsH-binding integral membrane protein
MDTLSQTQTPTYTANRSDFIMKTYRHVVGGLLAFLALEYLLFSTGIAYTIAAPLASNWLIVIGGLVLVSYLAAKFATPAYSTNVHYLVMGAFILVEAIIFVPLILAAAATSGVEILQQAGLITLGMTLALMAVVHTFKTNFSFLGPFLAILGIGALGLIVCSLIFGFQLGFAFSFAMIVYASGAILYETSKIKDEYEDGMHVAAALSLLTSVLLLLWYVVSALMSSND